MFRISLLISTMLIGLLVKGQGNSAPGLRYVENFQNLNIGLEKTQVWDIEQGEGGFTFLATNEGLGIYDGMRWEICDNGLPMIIRSLFYCNANKTLYCGAVNEFGKWVMNTKGKFEYQLLFKNTDTRITYEFWRTGKPFGSDLILFQSDHAVFAVDANDNTVKTIEAKNLFRYMHFAGTRTFVQDGNSLFELDKNLNSKPFIQVNDRIIQIETYEDDTLIIFFEHKGIFLVDNSGLLTPLNNKLNIELENAKIFSACRYNKNVLLAGTTRNGLYEITTSGEIISVINEESGLNSTSVLSLSVDDSKDIWLGLDNGIAKIDNSSGETYLLGKPRLGTIQSVIDFNGQIYLGSNKGLFVIRNNSYELIENTLGPVWGLYNIGNELYFTHDQGIFMVEGNSVKRIKEGGSTSLTSLGENSGLFISGDYQGISLLELKDGILKYVGKIKNYIGSSRHILFDKYGYLWIKIERVGFTRLTLSDDKLTVTNVKHFKMNPNGEESRVSFMRIDNEPVFYSNHKAYQYDLVTDSLMYSDYLTTLVNTFGSDIISVTQTGNNFLYQTANDIGIVRRRGKQLEKISGLFSKVYNRRISQSFTILSDSTFAIGFQNGIGFYRFTQRALQKPNIRMVEAIGVGDPLFFDFSNQQFITPFNKRFIRVYPIHLGTNKLIEYRIIGLDTSWQTSLIQDYLELTHLTQGQYEIQIRTPGVVDNKYASVSLRITRPWYFSNIMIVSYILIMIVLFMIIRRYYNKKGEKEKIRIAEEIKLKQKEKIEKLEKEKLKIEIREKDKRLATITMTGLQKRSLLNSLKDSFTRIYEKADISNYKDGIKKAIQLLDKQLENNEEWELLEQYYNNIYDGLLDRLKENYPTLTVADMKLCVYIKLKLNNKEIADLLGISPRSVEMARYRLRKKMNLNAHDDFSTILS